MTEKKEYIERGALLEKSRWVTEYDEGGWGIDYRAVSEEEINNAPAADVVEVVRCKGCVWCAYGDVYYCGCHDKPLKRIDRATNCKEFVESELGDAETGRMYKPRPRKEKVKTISMMDGGEE